MKAGVGVVLFEEFFVKLTLLSLQIKAESVIVCQYRIFKV